MQVPDAALADPGAAAGRAEADVRPVPRPRADLADDRQQDAPGAGHLRLQDGHEAQGHQHAHPPPKPPPDPHPLHLVLLPQVRLPALRYLSNLPEVYPQILSEGYFWFTDLSTYDPYFVLPVLAACGTSLSIARSPNLARNNLTMPFLAPYVKYLKYIAGHAGTCPSPRWPSPASSPPPSTSTG